jgi:hypothetical protein
VQTLFAEEHRDNHRKGIELQLLEKSLADMNAGVVGSGQQAFRANGFAADVASVINFTRIAFMARWKKAFPRLRGGAAAFVALAIHPAGRCRDVHGDTTLFSHGRSALYRRPFPGGATRAIRRATPKLRVVSHHNSIIDPVLIRKYVLPATVFEDADKSQTAR